MSLELDFNQLGKKAFSCLKLKGKKTIILSLTSCWTDITMKKITFLLLLIWSTWLSGQSTYFFKKLTTREGLSQSSILSIVQDKQGFMWFGTMDGLNRFDGYTVTVFKKEFNDSHGLQNNRINDLKVDDQGNLWIAHDLGVNRYNPQSGTFLFFRPQNKDEFIVNQLAVVNEDQVLVSTPDSLFVLHVRQQNFVPIAGGPFFSLKLRKFSNDIFVIVHKTIYLFKKQKLQKWLEFPSLTSEIVDFRFKNKHQLCLLTRDQLLEFTLPTKQKVDITQNLKKQLGLSSIKFTTMLKIDEDCVWLGSNQGIVSVRLQDHSFELISTAQPNNLLSKNINRLYKDETGIVWIGTYDSGVNYIDLNHGGFFNVLPQIAGKQILSSRLVYALLRDDNNTLWIGTDEGLNQLDLTKNRVFKVVDDAGKPILENARIRSLLKDQQGNLWIGTYDGVFKLNPQNGQLRVYRPYENRSKNIILVLFQMSPTKLLVGLKEFGLFVFDISKEIFVPVKSAQGKWEEVKNLFVTDIKRDESGQIYVATYGNGLFRYDPLTNRLLPAIQNPTLNKKTRLIYCIFPVDTATLWLGTFGEGMFLYKHSSQTFEQLNSKSGMPNDVVYGILQDEAGNFWVSTNKGLCKVIYRPEHHPLPYVERVFDYTDGLPDNEFNFGAYFKYKNWLYFGTVNGLTYFNPANFKINTNPPRVYITEILVNHQPLAQLFPQEVRKQIWQTHQIKLDYDQNTLGFRFTALHYSNPSKNKLAYRLKGFEENWTYITSFHQQVVYRKLKGGNYVFQVKAANADGVWNPQIASIKVLIARPFWQLWWFRLALLLGLLALAYLIHNLRTLKIRERNRLLHEFNQKLKMENEEKVKIMATLKETLEKFQTIFNNAPLGIFYVDHEGRITEGNENFLKIVGSSYKKIIGLSLISDIRDQKLIKAIREALNGKTGYYEGHYTTVTSNKTIPVRVLIRGIHSIDGKIIGAVGIVEDLTEMEKERLKDSVIRNISQAVITTENLQSFYEVFDRELSKIINTKNLFVALYDDQHKLFTFPLMKDERDAFEAVPAQGTISYYVIQKGHPCLFTESDIKRMQKEGLVEIVGTLSKCWLGVPLKIENQIIGILVVQDYENENAFDQETLQLLEVLSSSLASSINQKQNREIISLLTKGISQSSLSLIIANRNGDIIYSNLQFKMTDLPEGRRKKLADLLKYRLEGNAEFIERCLQNGEKWSGEISRKINEKQTRWEFLSINPVLNENKQVTHFVVVIEDITEAKRLQNQLQQTQKIESIGTLAGGIAHDFNNLLTVINGHAEIALLKLNQNKKIHSDIVSILHAGKRAANLTRQLLAFSRKQIFKAELLDINEVIRSMEKMVRRLIGEDILIEIELSPRLPYIKADPSQLEQVLLNLIVNARDAIHEWQKRQQKHAKVIKIKTEKVVVDKAPNELEEIQRGTYIVLSVSDTGIGMDSEVKEKVFEPFFTTKEVGQGTGLGLSTVYGIVKQNQGFIELESEPGKGTIFKVFWPVAQENIKDKPQDTTDGGDNIVSGQGNILVVEDDDSVREFMKDILMHSGYNVFTAKNGKEGADLIEKINFHLDLVITDMIMPEMNGNELADLVHKKFPETKILYTSGYTETRIIHEELMHEGTQFLHKPFTIVEFTNAINKLLEQ